MAGVKWPERVVVAASEAGGGGGGEAEWRSWAARISPKNAAFRDCTALAYWRSKAALVADNQR